MPYLVMAAILILCCFSVPQADASSSARESLRGLSGVAVDIENISKDAEVNGLTQRAIRTSVEDILRSSGVRVLTPQEKRTTPSEPALYVGVWSLKEGPEYSLCVEVNLTQIVSLVSRPDFQIFVPTWRSMSVGRVGSHKLKDTIAVMVEPKIRAFANDFLAANRRPSSTSP